MDNVRTSHDTRTTDAATLPRVGRVRALLVALRPHQWLKNLLVLAPILFSQNLFNPQAVARGLAAFALFCLAGSAGYLLNDIRDAGHDRLHPSKHRRPIAARELTVRAALVSSIVLALASLAGAFALDPMFALVVAAYLSVSLAYTFALKHQVILDVFAIAAGFVLRAVAGALAIHVEMSSWLLVCTTLLSLFLGFSKRRHELLLLKEGAGDHRQVLDEYNPRFLDMMIGIVTACTVTSYTLYTVSEETTERFHTRGLLLTIPFVLYGVFRYLYLVYHRERGGDPIETAFADRATLVNLALWTAAVVLVLYLR